MPTKIRVPLTNFQFGELSPSMISRTDLSVYNNAAKKITNLLIKSEGGLKKRFGSQKIYEFDTTIDTTKTQQIRIEPFIFSDDERYIVSFEHQKIRVFIIDPTTGVVSLTATITQDTDAVTLPITDSILQEISFVQAGDTMFIAHSSFAFLQLTRTSLTAFEVRPYVFDVDANDDVIYQPFYPFQPLGMTLDVDKTTGTGAVLTTSADYFTSDHVGKVIRYQGNEIEITAYTNATTATGTIKDKLEVHLDFNAFKTTEGIADVEVTQVAHGLNIGDAIVVDHAGAVGGISKNQLNGARTIVDVLDENRYVFQAGANATQSVDGGGTPKIETHAPTITWDEQAWSSIRGFPTAICFHENRLWADGTSSKPNGIWATKIGQFFNWDVGDGADNDGLDLTATVGEINSIRHIVSNRDLQLFTSTSEFYIPSLTTSAITPTNAQIKSQTPYGASYVQPKPFDGSTIYVQRNGNVVREYVFDDSEGAYVSGALSVLSSHLIKTPKQLCIAQGALERPESYAFFVNNDGTISVLYSDRVNKKAGWSEITTNGEFHSICTVDERVFATAKYDLGDGTDKYILMELTDNANLDFSGEFSFTAGVATVSSQFNNGAVVAVVDGDDYYGEFTVAGGQVDISSVSELTASNVEVGYKFDIEAITLPIDANASNGPITGEPRSVNKVTLDLLDTLSVSVNNTKLLIYQVTDDFSQSRNPVTGKKEFRLLGYSKDPVVTISQSAPLKMQVNGLVAEVIF